MLEIELQTERARLALFERCSQWPVVDRFHAFSVYRYKLICGDWRDVRAFHRHMEWATEQFGKPQTLFVNKIGEKHGLSVNQWHVPDVDLFLAGRWFGRYNVFRFSSENDAALFKLFRM